MEMRRDRPEMSIADLNGRVCLENTGCTATMAYFYDNRLVVASVGDSQAVLARECSSPTGAKAHDMSVPHTCRDEDEVARIVKAGLQVGPPDNPRVAYELAVPRSLGDVRFKMVDGLGPAEQPVSCKPGLMGCELQEGDDFLVIACDGIFDVMSTQEVIEFVHTGLASGAEPVAVVHGLMDNCVAKEKPDSDGLGGDNMTVVLVLLPPPQEPAP